MLVDSKNYNLSVKNFFIFFFRNCKVLIILLLRKKKRYDFVFDMQKVTNVYLKNTLVNTYLSMTVNNQIVFAKSSGSVGFKKNLRQ